MCGDENTREQCSDGNGGESDDLRNRDVAAARGARDNLADVSVDHDAFGADAGTGEKSQSDEPACGRGEGAGGGEDGGEQQQRHEDDAPAKTVAADAESDRADEHAEKARGDEFRELLQREEVRLLERGADV